MDAKRRLLFIAIGAGVATQMVPLRAIAGGGGVSGCPGCATEITQIMNNVQLVQAEITRIKQLTNEILMYKDMIQNTLNIPAQIWSNVTGDIMQLRSAIQNGFGISYAMQNISESFKLKFPSWDQGNYYGTKYKEWSQASLDSIQGALQAFGLQAQQFQTEEGLISQLRGMSSSSQGRMQALQVANQVGVEQVAQMQKLRELTMIQAQAHNNFMAAQQADEAAQVDGLLKFMERKNKKVRTLNEINSGGI